MRCPSSVFRGFVTDDADPDAPNPILKDPAIQGMLTSNVELPTVGILGGPMAINFG
jgi:hypothetical protein